jgi:hypothetical protein
MVSANTDAADGAAPVTGLTHETDQNGADPTGVGSVLPTPAKPPRRAVGKTNVFFGPPLVYLTAEQKNTLEVSGRLNRTAERYLEILRYHGLELTEPERACLADICQIGFMSPLEIRELPDEVRWTKFEREGLDKNALATKLEALNFADLVAIVESLGF